MDADEVLIVGTPAALILAVVQAAGGWLAAATLVAVVAVVAVVVRVTFAVLERRADEREEAAVRATLAARGVLVRPCTAGVTVHATELPDAEPSSLAVLDVDPINLDQLEQGDQ